MIYQRLRQLTRRSRGGSPGVVYSPFKNARTAGSFRNGCLQKTAPRILTQLVSRIVFYSGFSGIYYLSKYGHDIENWALFEPFQITVRDPEPVRIDDSDLQLGLRLHSLKLKE